MEKIQKTIETIIDVVNEKERNLLANLPLIWEVKPNIIEKEYIDWVCNINAKNILITWPWREVKFLPLLITEFLFYNQNKKAAIIGEINANSKCGEIMKPSVDEAFRNLWYLSSLKKIDEFDPKIKKEMYKFDKKSIFLKKRIFWYQISEVSNKSQYNEDICLDTFNKCKNKIKKMIELDFGKKAIRKLEIKKKIDGKISKEILNENGFIDLKISEREQYLGGTLKYNRQWLWEVLLNLKNVRRPNKQIPSVVLINSNGIKITDKRLFFISSEIEPQSIFEILDIIKPELIIFQKIDDFIKDYIFNGEKSKLLFKFLSKSEKNIILMFSTNPEVRYLYGINYSSEYSNNNFLDKYKIIPHTWDSEIIIENVKKRQKDNYHVASPLSSLMCELPGSSILPEITYLQIECLDKLEDFINKISIIFDGKIGRDIKKYLYDLRKSPLLLRDFWRKGHITGREINYDYLQSLIYNSAGKEEVNKVEKLFNSIYEMNTKNKNPIMEKIKEEINKLLRDSNNFISIIVHQYDVKKTRELLCKFGYKKYIPHKLDVFSWGSVIHTERKLRDKMNHYIISTIPPSFDFEINSSIIKKIIFIGGTKFTEKIKTILENRLTTHLSKPLYIPIEEDSIPPLLKEIMNDVGIQSNETILDLIEESVFEFEDMYSYTSRYEGDSRHSVIQAGERALLLIDFGKKGVFLPEGTTLLIKNDGILEELEIGVLNSIKKLENMLIKKEILLDKKGLYTSFKADFIKLMMIYAKRVIFTKGPFRWDGFFEIFEDSIHWINVIKRTIKEYALMKDISYEKAEKEISVYLASLDLNAKDPNYIKSWWDHYGHIKTESGIYYLYKVERPKSCNDLIKIFEGIKKLMPNLQLDVLDAYRGYAAAISIQQFRRSLLKGKIKKVAKSLYMLYNQLEKEIKKIVEGTKRFKVNIISIVEIKKEVEPFKIIEDFRKYIS